MPLDVNNFITPEQTFAPLYKIGDDLHNNKVLQQKQAAADKQAKQQEQTNKNNTQNYLKGYLDPKKFLINSNGGGEVYNTMVTQELGGLMSEATNMVSQGLSATDITFLLSPKVQQLSEGSQNVKTISNNISNVQKQLSSKNDNGIDPVQYGIIAGKSAFTNPDGSLKKMGEVDPQSFDANSPLDNPSIYTDKPLMNWVKDKSNSAPKIEKGMTIIGSDGRRKDVLGDLKMPSYAQVKYDAKGNFIGFEPKHEIVTDEDKPLINKFDKTEGYDGSNIRMLPLDDFKSLPSGTLLQIGAEVKDYIKGSKLDLSSTQAEMLARSLAYKKLESYANDKSNYSLKTLDKKAPIRSHGGSNNPNGNPEIKPYDAWNPVLSTPIGIVTDGDGTKFDNGRMVSNIKDGTSQLSILNKFKEVDKYAKLSNLFITTDSDGVMKIRDITKPFNTLPITEMELNAAASDVLGANMKTKTKILNEPDTPKTTNIKTKGTTKKLY